MFVCVIFVHLQELGLDSDIVGMACQAAEILMIMRQVCGLASSHTRSRVHAAGVLDRCTASALHEMLVLLHLCRLCWHMLFVLPVSMYSINSHNFLFLSPPLQQY